MKLVSRLLRALGVESDPKDVFAFCVIWGGCVLVAWAGGFIGGLPPPPWLKYLWTLNPTLASITGWLTLLIGAPILFVIFVFMEKWLKKPPDHSK
jgi:hypothetical protein